MAKNVDAEWVEKKLRSANDTMESVQTLSLWALKHKNQCEQIVAIWLKVLKSEEPSKMIVMFFLCNEVLQTCKRKNAIVYKESFKNVLKEAVSVVKDEKAVLGLEKILSVWGDRKVFEDSFIAELSIILNGGPVEEQTLKPEEITAPTQESSDIDDPNTPIIERRKLDLQISDFNLSSLCTLLKNDSKLKSKFKEEMAKCSKFVDDIDSIRSKDSEIQKEYLEENEDKVNDLCRLYLGLDSYLDNKHQLCEHLDNAVQFYEGLLKDAKLVSSAYKNYGTRIQNLSKKLADRRHLLMLSEQSKQEEEEEEEDDESNQLIQEGFEKYVDESESVPESPRGRNREANQRQRSSSGEEFNVYKDIGRSEERVEDEEDKLFTHLFLEDPSEDDRHHHQPKEIEASRIVGSRRQSLDARLESMGFSGLHGSTETKKPSVRHPPQQIVRDDVRKSNSIEYKNNATDSFDNVPPSKVPQEQPKVDSTAPSPINTSYQIMPNLPMEFLNSVPPQISFNPPSFQVFNQPQQLPLTPIQPAQPVFFPHHLFVPQISQAQQIIQITEVIDDGRVTPVQDEPPSPQPTSEDRYLSKSSKMNFHLDDNDLMKNDDYESYVREFCKKSELSMNLKKERDYSPRISSDRHSHREEDRRHRERSNRKKDHHHYQHSDDKRKSGRDKRRIEDDSREYSKSSRSRHKSRGSSRESEKRSRRSSNYSSKGRDSSHARSKTRDPSPAYKRRINSRSLSSSSSSPVGDQKPKVASSVRKPQTNSIVMEGVYQAIDRPDGYSEIFRMPSNVDPNQYTYEEVVYLFTEEDGTPQLKQLSQNVPQSSGVLLHSSDSKHMPGNIPLTSSSVLSSYPEMMNSFKSPVTSMSQIPTILPAQPQSLMPINVMQGMAQSMINPSVLRSGQVQLQVPPPPLPQQPVYPFVQQPPPPLPQIVPPVISLPSLLSNQLKDSVIQPSSLMGIPIANQIATSASNFGSSFQGMSKVLPSPSQFCQGIGATALLQRRLDENSQENLSRTRTSLIQGGKLVQSSSKRASTLTTIPLTDDVSESSGCHKPDDKSGFPARKMSNDDRESHSEDVALQNILHGNQIVLESSSSLPIASFLRQERKVVSRGTLRSESCLAKSDSQIRTGGYDSDNGSSDLDEFQDAVTFTSPLLISGSSTASYSRVRETNNQPGLLKKTDASRSHAGPPSSRGLLPNSFIPQRLPLFSTNQFQQLQQMAPNFNMRQNFGQVPGMSLRLSAVPTFNFSIPLSMPMNRLDTKGNPRF